MKNIIILPAVVFVALSTSLTAVAKGPGGGPGGPGRGGPDGKPGRGPIMKGDKGPDHRLDRFELGAKHEKFRIWMNAVYGGARFFGDDNKPLQKEYRDTYDILEKGLIKGRVDEPKGREFKAELVSIGEQFDPADKEATEAALKELNGKIRKEIADNEGMPEEAQSPTLNARQLMLENVLQWAVEDKELSSGRASTFETKLGLIESKEDRYKANDELSDRERETLHEEIRELSRDVIEAIVG